MLDTLSEVYGRGADPRSEYAILYGTRYPREGAARVGAAAQAFLPRRCHPGEGDPVGTETVVFAQLWRLRLLWVTHVT
jgi:hypothetical protein